VWPGGNNGRTAISGYLIQFSASKLRSPVLNISHLADVYEGRSFGIIIQNAPRHFQIDNRVFYYIISNTKIQSQQMYSFWMYSIQMYENKGMLTWWSRKSTKYIYTEHHSVCPLVGIGTPPNPLPQASVPVPSPRTKGWGAAAAAKGVGEFQFRRLEKKLSTLPTL
jgi:hypothetical protein